MSSQLGYLAAVVSCLSFGSFAVPIKGRIANEIDIDPLVMQTYKTVVCFATSWLVLLLPNVHLTFTWWGMVSGLFWVPGGTAGIFAVRNTGLAVSQGTWSALKVTVAFAWGMLIFREQVRSKVAATAAVLLLIVGLWGMSYFSSLSPAERQQQEGNHDSDDDRQQPPVNIGENDLEEPLLQPDHQEDEGNGSIVNEINEEGSSDEVEIQPDPLMVDLGCMKLSRRTAGMICACIDGLWGGSILVPMHFAKTNTEGLEYVISFAVGATTVLNIIWIIRIAYNTVSCGSVSLAIQQLPSLHLGAFWAQGGLAGLLWSLGNVSSMLSVEYLGEGVGYSTVQAQMLVAGLYGVFWYREVQGWRSVSAWFTCALMTLCGILLLSYEHVKSKRLFN